jgi:Ca2+-binding RTX toxin-like protein
MVDWGTGTDGMQNPAGHRIDIMNAAYNEVGIAIVDETSASTQVGPQVVTEDFGVRSGSRSFVTGVAYSDRDGDDFYSVGEGRGDLVVSDSSGSITSYASGGYSLLKSAAATTVTLSGGGLSGDVTVVLPASALSVKLDVVGGHELKVTGAVGVSGPVDRIEGVGFNIDITAKDGLAHTIVGTAHDDVLSGTTGAVVIQGGAGSDTITGGSSNDHLYGAGPNGGADGADLINGGDGGDYIQGNAGNDTIHGGNGDDRINGGADNDTLYGDAGNDSINGNAGNDLIDGGAGDDYVRGGQGDDTVGGGDGNDLVTGDLGNDRLIGGAGIDTLTGGAGNDTFVFSGIDAAFARSGAGGTDTITDFEHGLDHLALGFTAAAVLHASAADFAAALTQAQTLLAATSNDVAAVQVGQDAYLFYGASGGTTIDSAIKLAGINGATIGTSDFV